MKKGVLERKESLKGRESENHKMRRESGSEPHIAPW